MPFGLSYIQVLDPRYLCESKHVEKLVHLSGQDLKLIISKDIEDVVNKII